MYSMHTAESCNEYLDDTGMINAGFVMGRRREGEGRKNAPVDGRRVL